jgi:hypothetical protein
VEAECIQQLRGKRRGRKSHSQDQTVQFSNEIATSLSAMVHICSEKYPLVLVSYSS